MLDGKDKKHYTVADLVAHLQNFDQKSIVVKPSSGLKDVYSPIRIAQNVNGKLHRMGVFVKVGGEYDQKSEQLQGGIQELICI